MNMSNFVKKILSKCDESIRIPLVSHFPSNFSNSRKSLQLALCDPSWSKLSLKA